MKTMFSYLQKCMALAVATECPRDQRASAVVVRCWPAASKQTSEGLQEVIVIPHRQSRPSTRRQERRVAARTKPFTRPYCLLSPGPGCRWCCKCHLDITGATDAPPSFASPEVAKPAVPPSAPTGVHLAGIVSVVRHARLRGVPLGCGAERCCTSPLP